MTKTKINLFDNTLLSESFVAASTKTGGGKLRTPENVTYVKNKKVFDGITIYTDQRLTSVLDTSSTHKVAWLVEPRSYDPTDSYSKIITLEDEFDLIFTYDQELLNRSSKYVFVPADTVCLGDEHIRMYEKSKGTSMIYSEKTQLPGHQLRHIAAQQLIPSFAGTDREVNVDFYGKGHGNFIKRKVDGLKDYMFSIVIENSYVPGYFTEKLLDCFAAGVVPIYWGCPNVADFFNQYGIITFDGTPGLKTALESVSRQTYLNKKIAIEDNFNRVGRFLQTDDYVLGQINERLG